MAPVDIGTVFDSEGFQVIEWHMLDMPKYLSLNVASSFLIRTLTYPLTVVKTRIQVNPSGQDYRGTFSTLRHIVANEGSNALYRGFIVNSFQLLSGLSYVLSYEKIRTALADRGINNLHVRAFIGGGCASAFGQLILVPLDIVSQHMMTFRSKYFDPLNLRSAIKLHPDVPQALLICREIYKRDGFFRGFYRGYFASLLCYAPSSALFWTLYQFYNTCLQKIQNRQMLPILAINAVAAPCAAVSSAVLTNALDVFRANLQIQRSGWSDTFFKLWQTERWRILTKGLPTRMLSASVSSFFFITTYELVKRLSVHQELKAHLQW